MGGLGFYHVNHESQTAPPVAPPEIPARSPYAESIAASGVVEARTENIAIGAALAGIVLEVYVPSDRAGTPVTAGQPLFRVDDRHLKAQLKVAEAQLLSAQTRLARRKVASPVTGSVQQIYYRVGELVPEGKPIVALLPPTNLKVRFFVNEAMLPRLAVGDTVHVSCDGCDPDITAKISFIARTSEFTPPVIYSTEERAKLVFLIEARPERPGRLRVGQPVSVALEPGK